MSSDSNRTTFEFNGEKSLERAQDILGSYSIDGTAERIYVEIDEIHDSEPKETTNSGSEKSDSSKSDDRELQGIRGGTSHSKVLAGLNSLSDDWPVATKEVLKTVDLPEGTVYAAMSDLYSRRLVDRSDEKNSNNNYEYEVNPAGIDELERLGLI
ncbi:MULTISPECIES: hypothetical protein [unclassified Haloarcula]|uniref:hypothetical protein n=1 Tax=unclassified Haloarcula TaxID=2624677 RepID=UPI000A6A1A83|nr:MULTISPECIES: hypothetical protein [unclassified Haloarcula]